MALAEFEDLQRKVAADAREAADPTLTDNGGTKSATGNNKKEKGKKGPSSGPPKIQALTEPQKIRDEIKILCKNLHTIPAVRGVVSESLS